MNIIQRFFSDNRFRFLIISLGCALLLGVGFILQYQVGLTPCPLCILQRFFFALTGLTALIAFIQKADIAKTKIYSGIMIAFSLIGGLIAARQVWLQYAPVNLLAAPCAPWLGSLTDVIKSVFNATADCAERGWTLLTLSIPEWSLISFIILIFVSSISFWKKH